MKSKFILLGLCCSLVACGSSNSKKTSNSSSNSVVNSSSSTVLNVSIVGPSTMEVGDLVTYSLSSSVANVKWQSSDSKVVEINSRGEAISWKEGVVTISALDSNNNVLATIEVTVEDKVSYPTNEMELHVALNNAKELEKEGSDFVFIKNSTTINQHYSKTVKAYKNFFISNVDDEYTNHTGYHHELSTEFYGIKDGYFFDVADSNESSYGIKRKVVASNPTDYEISESLALERIEDPNMISQFVNYFGDIWGARTLGLNIEV